MQPVSLVVEGACDEAVLRRLIEGHGLTTGPVYVTSGKARLDQRLAAYQNAGRHQPWIVLRDLDVDAECAPTLLERYRVEQTSLFRLQLAVRAIEAWLLADRQGFARFLSVPVNRVPLDPESIKDPKQYVVQLARQSRSRAIVGGLVPDPGTSASVGRSYATRLIEFSTCDWDPSSAAIRSPSLSSLIRHLTRLALESRSRE